MVRLKKYKQEQQEGKKSFHLQTPMSLWSYFENYCNSLNINPTKALNILIKEELEEAGVIPTVEHKSVVKDKLENEQSNVEIKEDKKEQKKKPTKRRTKKQTKDDIEGQTEEHTKKQS